MNWMCRVLGVPSKKELERKRDQLLYTLELKAEKDGQPEHVTTVRMMRLDASRETGRRRVATQ